MNEMKNAPLVPITDVLSFIVDNRGKTVPTAESGFPLIATNCVHNERLYPVFENIRYVSEYTLHNWFRAELKANDILFVNKGTPGRCCLVPDPVSFCAAQDMIGLRCDEQKVYYRYLLMVLRSTTTQKFISNYHVGIAIPHFKKEDLSKLLIPLPSMEYQKRIGDLYFDICEKEEHNNSICADLEAMAKLLYDYWFVQFDFPDENGKPYKSSGGKMVWNEELKREIPEGWKITTIGNITICHDSERIPVAGKDRESMKGNIPYYGATGIMGYVNRAIFNGDYVLMAEDGSVMDSEGHPVVQRVSGACWINNHAHVLESTNGYSCKLLMMILKDIPVMKIKTGSIQMKINQENMNSYRIIDIQDCLKQTICEKLDVFDEQLLHLHNENKQLVSVRDFLLPMLMNGQVKVGGKE